MKIKVIHLLLKQAQKSVRPFSPAFNLMEDTVNVSLVGDVQPLNKKGAISKKTLYVFMIRSSSLGNPTIETVGF
ncbi:hypothetical protein BLD48_14555 [Exiguobacterium sp. KRL4]|uniref:hypothetical protein n=1 Tax=Exiguobacterium sp. KRL4 TaxID=1914536 RepID=UPI0008F928F0|nr:hypothetical protein [Exiguobacterium sp. KRL4]OIN65714.1 hypothetical protein BLD48_14555 [Exiguobacterium sp. KRL4]